MVDLQNLLQQARALEAGMKILRRDGLELVRTLPINLAVGPTPGTKSARCCLIPQTWTCGELQRQTSAAGA